jgi:hypothetical protein
MPSIIQASDIAVEKLDASNSAQNFDLKNLLNGSRASKLNGSSKYETSSVKQNSRCDFREHDIEDFNLFDDKLLQVEDDFVSSLKSFDFGDFDEVCTESPIVTNRLEPLYSFLKLSIDLVEVTPVTRILTCHALASSESFLIQNFFI